MKQWRIKQIRAVESSPEKAGVGGSIPSLATNFSNTYKPFPEAPRMESKSPSQFWMVATVTTPFPVLALDATDVKRVEFTRYRR